MKIKKTEKENPEYNYRMLTLARESRGYSQQELAQLIGMTQGKLSKAENGLQVPLPEMVEKISQVLDYPADFFKQQEKIFDLSLFHYRKRLQAGKKELEKCEARINITRINIEKLLRSIELTSPNYPWMNAEQEGDPQRFARKLREWWKVPGGRVEDLTRLAEDHGILVVNMDLEEAEIDGLTILTEKRTPMIFLSNEIPADRYRLTLAHEIGHLVMHTGREIPSSRDVEEEAFLFGAELLMPEKEIKDQLSEKLDLEKLADLKKYWKVSMGALLKRAKVLGVVSDNQYQYLWKQMGSLGYKKKEPAELDFPKEQPSLLKEMLDAHLRELEYSEEELATLLCLKQEEFQRKYLSGKPRLRIIR